jgi:hypothetical protein
VVRGVVGILHVTRPGLSVPKESMVAFKPNCV